LLGIFDNYFGKDATFIFVIVDFNNVLRLGVIAIGCNINYFAKLLSELLLLPAEFILDHLAIELFVLGVVAIVLNKIHDFLYFFAFWRNFLALLLLESFSRLLLSISIRLLFSYLLLNFISIVVSFHFCRKYGLLYYVMLWCVDLLSLHHGLRTSH